MDLATLIERELYPTPRWFPQSLDAARQTVRMVALTEADYRGAPFLDHRGLRKGMIEGVVPWRSLSDLTMREHRSDAHWIFHIGHVGSTLISRLLGECGDVLALREPPLLRSLLQGSTAQAIERLPVMRRLFSRCFRPEQRAIVKATSVVSELAIPLIGPEAEGGKAVFISIHPRDHIIGRLTRGRTELLNRAPERLARLARRKACLDRDEAMASDARVAAMSWACEAVSIEAAMERIDPTRWIFADFAEFLSNPTEQLTGIARHFGIGATDQEIAAIVAGPLIRKNAKGREAGFDADQRRSDETDMLSREQDRIEDALAWLERARPLSPLLERACARFE